MVAGEEEDALGGLGAVGASEGGGADVRLGAAFVGGEGGFVGAWEDAIWLLMMGGEGRQVRWWWLILS